MCNLYSITTNQAAIIALFRVINRYGKVIGITAPAAPASSPPAVRETPDRPPAA